MQCLSQLLEERDELIQQLEEIRKQMEELYKDNYQIFEGRNSNRSNVIERYEVYKRFFTQFI